LGGFITGSSSNAMKEVAENIAKAIRKEMKPKTGGD